MTGLDVETVLRMHLGDGSDDCAECCASATVDEYVAHVAAVLRMEIESALGDAWPCDDYEAPLTCYTIPNGPKHLTCGGCRAAFPRGPEVQRLYRPTLAATEGDRQ